jgi:hypothetical protein
MKSPLTLPAKKRAFCAKASLQDVTAKSRHPPEEGDPCLFNYLKRMDSRLRGNDIQVLSRLFAVASFK